MILGVAHAETWIDGEVRKGGAGKPHLIKTQFGWTAVGGWKRGDIADITCYATEVDDANLRNDFRHMTSRRCPRRKWATPSKTKKQCAS